MPFTLDTVVPWGRSFDEYAAMFALSDEDLGGRILGCADGPASFNAELTERGGSVVSVDPIYQFTTGDIRARIDATYDEVLAQTRTNADEFVWTTLRSVDELARVRMDTMERFLADYDAGRATGRYIPGELPDLPFADDAFDLAVCSHFLFLYSEQLDANFHRRAIASMCRVAREARVFPLLELGSLRSRHVDNVIAALRAVGYGISVERVDYEFQKGGNEMLRVTRHA